VNFHGERDTFKFVHEQGLPPNPPRPRANRRSVLQRMTAEPCGHACPAFARGPRLPARRQLRYLQMKNVDAFTSPNPESAHSVGTLRCLECQTESEGTAAGWLAFLTDEDEVGIYCPTCAEREFGGD
jgi:hypothetical protein